MTVLSSDEGGEADFFGEGCDLGKSTLHNKKRTPVKTVRQGGWKEEEDGATTKKGVPDF